MSSKTIKEFALSYWFYEYFSEIMINVYLIPENIFDSKFRGKHIKLHFYMYNILIKIMVILQYHIDFNNLHF